ncbi:MAG: GGDEF domain-containing protein [Clostridiales bacterium]|nr:GGDEF domain-containing protein [Candidatus Blautia equi]
MKLINRLLELIRRDTSDENEAGYFLIGLRTSYFLMGMYFVLFMCVGAVFGMWSHVIYAAIWLAMMSAGFWQTFHQSYKSMFAVYIFLIVTWSIISICSFGWNTGGQQFLLPLLVMVFFCVYYSTKKKIFIMLFLLVVRLGLFFYSQHYEPRIPVGYAESTILQVLNSITLFIGITAVGVIFSSNLQGAEKKLMRANEKLKTQAGTDPLTGLSNRRNMTELIERWRSANPMSNFSFAMADIDYFKRVNDTWGHDCGDEVLRSLADLFKGKVKGKGYVCRWGGEEFFFFFPDLNLDQAKFEVQGICQSVRGLTIPYGQQELHVTMTFGVEENDFTSDLKELVRQADEKLYYGKDHGRNCVIG